MTAQNEERELPLAQDSAAEVTFARLEHITEDDSVGNLSDDRVASEAQGSCNDIRLGWRPNRGNTNK